MQAIYRVCGTPATGLFMHFIDECIAFLTCKAAQQLSRRSRERLSEFGVTVTQYSVLCALWERDGLSGAEIGARLVFDSATVTGLIDRLQGAALIERRADENDRRVNRVFLTAKGRALRGPMTATMQSLNEDVDVSLGEFAPLFRNQLRELARREPA
jgi:MarR family transcriptional regulator, organic hydroperoxide resistance regulator